MTFKETWCQENDKWDPYSEDVNHDSYINELFSQDNRINFGSPQNSIALVFLLIPFTLQICFFRWTYTKENQMKIYTHDKPTYCVLTVYVIHTLRLALGVSLLESLIRLIFTLFGDGYAEYILKDNSWL